MNGPQYHIAPPIQQQVSQRITWKRSNDGYYTLFMVQLSIVAPHEGEIIDAMCMHGNYILNMKDFRTLDNIADLVFQVVNLV